MSVKATPAVSFLEAKLPPPTGETTSGGDEYRACHWSPLPQQVDEAITSDLSNGVVRSWKPNCPVSKKDLAYMQITHWTSEKEVQTGELIVNKDVVDDVEDVFHRAFGAKFPIQKMWLIENYDADDDKSMEDNNTSAFCSREITLKTGVFSKHSYGRAIDINPLVNPYYNKTRDVVFPKAGKPYLDRSKEIPGMIKASDVVCRAFAENGWTWGGNWKDPTDYQHFEKSVLKV